MGPDDPTSPPSESGRRIAWSALPAAGNAPVVWIHPFDRVVAAAVEEAGGVLGTAEDADAFVITHRAEAFPAARLHDRVRWVQLGTAGVDALLPFIDDARTWTGARGLYSWPVAEYALAAVMSAARGMPWRGDAVTPPRTVASLSVGIVGGGGIGARLTELLAGLGASARVFSRRGRPVPGARSSDPIVALDAALPELSTLVLAAPLTPETRGLIDARRLRLLPPGSWLINVGRGGLVDTQALVDALTDGALGGAILDVTDPEPLPPDHRLRSLANAIVTPHVACPPRAASEMLGRRTAENLRRLSHGLELVDVLDPAADY